MIKKSCSLPVVEFQQPLSLAKISSGLKTLGSETFPGILGGMIRWLILMLHLALAGLKSRRNLLLEILALRHQLLVLSRNSKRPRLTPLNRLVWTWLSRAWDGWRGLLCLV